MTLSEIEDICKKGKVGLIPGWEGYLKYDYARNLLYFINKSYITYDLGLIIGRNDLYYII